MIVKDGKRGYRVEVEGKKIGSVSKTARGWIGRDMSGQLLPDAYTNKLYFGTRRGAVEAVHHNNNKDKL